MADMGGCDERDLQSVLSDAATLGLRTTFDVDNVGNVISVTPPNGHSGATPLATHKTLLTYNSNDELIRRRSRQVSATNTTRNQIDFIYDANGNTVAVEAENRDETGALQSNAEFVMSLTYDGLNRRTQVAREIDPSTNATTTIAYTRNGLPRLFTFPEAVAGSQPNNTEHILYDERDLTFKMIRASGDSAQLTTQFDYDVNGNLSIQTAGLEEAVGNRRVTSFAYDGFDRLDSMTDALGHVTDYGYDGAGQVTDVSVRQGGTTPLSDVDYVYDLSGRNTQINRAFLDSSGSVISGTVNGVATGDGAANTVIGYTDSFHVETIAFEGNTTTRTYDTANRVATVTDPKSNVIAYTYDANSNVTILDETAANDLGGTQAFQTRFVYDQLDRLTQRRLRYSTASGGLFNDISFAYDSRNNLASQTDARGNDSTFAYDGLNRRTAASCELSPGGATVATSATYDFNSRLTQRTDPNGNTTQYRYDALDRLTDIIYADGTRDVQEYDRFGNPATRTDPAGTVFTTTYDKLNRLTGRTTTAATGFSNPGVESFTYDALSRLTSAQDADSLVTRDHDSIGNIQAETLQIDGGTVRTTSHTYDDNGNRKRTAYPGGRVLTLTHDARDRLDAITDATGSPFTLATYDYVGSRVARRTYNANGTQLDFTYDGIGSANPVGDFGFKRVIGTAHTVTSGGAVRDERTYLWDRDLNKLQRDDVRAGGPQLTHDYAYDGRSRMTGVTPSTGSPVSFTYDATGNRTSTGYVLQGADAALSNYTATPLDDRGYDLLGNLGSFDARDRWYTFDAQSRLTGYVLAGTRSVDDFSSGIPGAYTVQSGTWSVTNEVLSETSAATGRILRAFPTGTQEFSFSYRSPHDAGDTADFDPERYGLAILRLLEPASPAEWRYVALVIEPTGLYLREWEDDVLVAEHDSAGVAAEADTWYDVKVAYSGTNNTTLSVSWAKRGQPFEEVLSASVTLAEDPAQELGFGVGQNGDYEFRDVIFRDTTADTSTTQVTYQYDALGRRIARTVAPDGTPVRTEFYYDGPQIIEERNGAGSVQATYVYGRYVDEVLSMQRGGNDCYYHQDDLYNVMAVTDDTGAALERYEYGEFGEPSFFDGSGSSIGGTAIGNEFLFNGRQYDSDTGLYFYRSRYMDPMVGHFVSRDTIGLYGDANNLGNGQAYVGNNPWSRIDPNGLLSWGDVHEFSGNFYDLTIGDALGYARDSGNFAKGYFINGPVNMVAGTAEAAAHPIRTTVGVGRFGHALATDFSGTTSAIGAQINQQFSTFEGAGEGGFNIAVFVVPVAAAASEARIANAAAKVAAAERTAALAEYAATSARRTAALREFAVGQQMEFNFVPSRFASAATPLAGAPRTTAPIGQLRAAGIKDAHHVIQDAAVRDLPGYNSLRAPGVHLEGPSTSIGSPHYLATRAQSVLRGGTYAAEREIAADALRAAGMDEANVQQALSEADAYFESIGVEPQTRTRIPGNRW